VVTIGNEALATININKDVLRAANLLQRALRDETAGVDFAPGAPSLKTIWSKLRAEVHVLICTDSDRYAAERSLLSTTSKPAVAALTAFLTKDFGIEVASATALASLGLFLPLKIAVNAWCTAVSEGSPSTAEIEALQQLTSSARPE
jgi:hypothetical protein